MLPVTQSMLLDMVDCLGAFLRAPIPNKIRVDFTYSPQVC